MEEKVKKLLITLTSIMIAGTMMAATPATPTTQTNTTSGSALVISGSSNIAVVNMQNIIQGYAGTPALQQAYADEQKALEANLQTMQDQLEAQQNTISKLGNKATQAQTNSFQTLQNNYQEAYSQAQQTLQTFQNQQMTTFKGLVQAAIAQIAQNNGYVVVLDSQAVWSGGVDVTAQVIALMNTQYQQSQAASAKPTKVTTTKTK